MNDDFVGETPVAGILVTYNRQDLLKLAFKSFMGQTHRLSCLIIIDNASNLNTFETLKNLEVIPSELDFTDGPIELETIIGGIKVYYRRLSENEGGAGGFHEGIKVGMTKDVDWFWLMDDDVEASPDALQVLLENRGNSFCIHPAKRYSEGPKIDWEGRFSELSGRTIWNGNASFKRGQSVVEVNYGCFEGMLVHRDIVVKIGLPDKRFFIVNDDLIYGWLASKHTPVLYLNHVGLIKHRPVENKTRFLGFSENEINPFTQYFNVRNHFLLVDYLEKNGRSRKVLIIFLLIKVVKELLQASFKNPSPAMRKMILAGLRDGIKKKFGRPDFVPRV